MPPDHQKYVKWDGDRFRRWAAKVGDHTLAVVCSILEQRKVEQQGYKACMALLKLADQYSSQRLEAACERALGYTQTPSFKNVQTILRTGQDKQKEEALPPTSSSEYGLTRGANYYNGRDKGC